MAVVKDSLTVRVKFELTHAAPLPGSGYTGCCGATPFEIDRSHRLTVDMAKVTCPAAWLREGKEVPAAEIVAEWDAMTNGGAA